MTTDNATPAAASPESLISGTLTPPAAPAPAATAPATPADKPSDASSDLQRLIDAAVKAQVEPLQQKIAQYEGDKEKLQSQQRATSAREDYIRDTMRNFPPEIIRDLIPVTEDRAALDAAGMRIEQAFKKYLDNLVAGGHMKYVDVGGATRDGGMTPREAADQMMMADATPEQLISKSL